MADSTNVFPPGFRAEDDEGVIVGGGTVQFFAAGTTDPLEVFSDRALSISLGPTVGLNAGGYPVSSGGSRVIVYTGTDPYRIRLMDDDGVVVWEHDDVRGALDTADFDEVIAASFSPGTSMLFVQTNAPTGWTKQVVHNDAALRIVSGTASSGGSEAFTAVFDERTILLANLPNTSSAGTTNTTGAHAHTYADSADQSGVQGGGALTLTKKTGVGSTNSNGDHFHTVGLGGSGTPLDFTVKYVDAIIAIRD